MVLLVLPMIPSIVGCCRDEHHQHHHPCCCVAGAGTTDVAVLRWEPTTGKLSVLAVYGNPRLGGKDVLYNMLNLLVSDPRAAELNSLLAEDVLSEEGNNSLTSFAGQILVSPVGQVVLNMLCSVGRPTTVSSYCLRGKRVAVTLHPCCLSHRA